MVSMFLTGGKPAVVAGTKGPAPVISNQQAIMQVFVATAFAMVPLMLLVKPFYENSKNKTSHVEAELEMADVK